MSVSKKKPFDALFTGLEVVKDENKNPLNTVLYGKRGEPSVIFKIQNPVQQMKTDPDGFVAFHEILSNIVQTLGEGYALQKQDVFCRQAYEHKIDGNADFLSQSYFKYFNGREYTHLSTYLIITQEPQVSTFIAYDTKKWEQFHEKVNKVANILSDKGIRFQRLSEKEVEEYLHRYMAFCFTKGSFSMQNLKSSDECLKMGETAIRSFPLVDIDEVNLPSFITPYREDTVNGYHVAQDILGFLSNIPNANVVVYNQVVQIPQQRKLLAKLTTKAKRHASMPGAANQISRMQIEAVLERLALDATLMVYTNFNILVSCPLAKMPQITSFIETKLYDSGIIPSKCAYNQLELFSCSFPGNAYSFNKDYDLFLTLADAALCLFYKERMLESEDTPLTTYYTDRNGIPVAIDITGKEGKVKLTDNANFFCIGPSGSGKSFHMNSVVRQLLEQGTDVVMVDTGDSYQGICDYFQGTYITYSKDKPISMNPFKVTTEEYEQNFGEKKNFLKSLIFLIFKGDKSPSKIEDKIINQTIVEYYDAYFHPFEKFTSEQRADLRKILLLTDKKNGEFDRFVRNFDKEQSPRERRRRGLEESTDTQISALNIEKQAKTYRQIEKMKALVADENAAEGERQNALVTINRLRKEILQNHYLKHIEDKIDYLEKNKRRLKVKELSFNSYYEFALERIPQITREEHIDFDIHDFAAILKQFYRGGELEATLNSDLDTSLFDEQFIVFEIDKIKDDPVLFPIVVLIIMDVFLQKMRIKKGRKALIIEEAWKAIASPTMAEYIKYLYKTVRKFHGIAGVVTQELNDVIDSPIVKEAIINNSDIKILLDQTKFKDRYDAIANILGLTPVQRQQIFTINALNNKDGRNDFKEVWICRGLESDVFGVEEPPECYWAYTTERAEKEARIIYRDFYGSFQRAIEEMENDRKALGIKKYLDFARLVNTHKTVKALW